VSFAHFATLFLPLSFAQSSFVGKMTSLNVCEDGSLDIEVVIEQFITDSSKGSLELPHMTTGQRKQVKKAVDQKPELKCESYGFGAERRLHLFKKNWDNQQAAGHPDAKEVMSAVNIKNTFIDDWVGGDVKSEPVIFRSMPEGMGKHLQQPESLANPAAAPELSPIKEGSSPRSLSDASVGKEPVSSNERIEMANLEIPAGLEGFQVRNTFIHIDAEAVDDRMVQSMPHGMFSRAVEAEAPHKAVAKPIDDEAQVPNLAMPDALLSQAPVYVAAPVADVQLMPGTHVVVDGLVKCPAFNGLSGVIQSFEEETGRYSVLLASPTLPNGQQLAKVKAQNLRSQSLLPPPPPQYPAPTLLIDDVEAEWGSDSMWVPSTPEGAIHLDLTALVACY